MNRQIDDAKRNASAAACRTLLRLFCGAGLAVAATLTMGMPQAYAATAITGWPSITTCGLSGSITIVVAGISTTAPIGCLNKATQSSTGSSEQAVASVSVPPVLGLNDVADVETPWSRAKATFYGGSDASGTMGGAFSASSVRLLGQLLYAQGVNSSMNCTFPNWSTTPTCLPTTTIDRLMFGGQIQTLPAPIPPNYSLPLSGNISLLVNGLPVTVFVSGPVVFNEMSTTGGGYTARVQHALMHVTLSGGLNVAGTPLINVSIDLAEPITYCGASLYCGY